MIDDKMEKIVSLCKRRGFIYPACEIYGGFANSYSFGPYGAQLKKNIKDIWWKMFVEDRSDIIGLDGPIMLHPKAWQASGHTEGFNDALVDCKKCQRRFRADHLIENAVGVDLEGDIPGLNKVIKDNNVKCPECAGQDWTEVRTMNMMFQTEMNGIDEPVYLRPETAGAIFVEFKSVLDSMRVKLPFGIAQIGKAFRNEIVARNFIFRVREFEQMEIEYFFNPEEDWETMFSSWLEKQKNFTRALGISGKNIREYEHPQAKLSHYSKKTIDIEYNFPFGHSELFGLAHRGDFDLTAHSKASGQSLEYLDPESGKKFTPHVLEPTFGVERALLAALCEAYTEEEVDTDKRVVLKFPKQIAPVKVAVFPLLKNKPKLVEKATEVFDLLKGKFTCEFDDNGNVGKRYRRQDEIGTPYCVTVDFDTLEKDNTVTVRDRDTMEQERVKIEELSEFFDKKFSQ
ncbi:glycine--tRNA ligase [Candidatus Falkowbacteria bacterium]|nr:glycine--tRNA ligase [Candidatus Falkowbacteria bacterium]